jgi:hypothetical protein
MALVEERVCDIYGTRPRDVGTYMVGIWRRVGDELEPVLEADIDLSGRGLERLKRGVISGLHKPSGQRACAIQGYTEGEPDRQDDPGVAETAE